MSNFMVSILKCLIELPDGSEKGVFSLDSFFPALESAKRVIWNERGRVLPVAGSQQHNSGAQPLSRGQNWVTPPATYQTEVGCPVPSQLLTPYNLLIMPVCFVSSFGLPSPPEYMRPPPPPSADIFVCFFSLMYPRGQEHCLAHIKYSINICRKMTNFVKDKRGDCLRKKRIEQYQHFPVFWRGQGERSREEQGWCGCAPWEKCQESVWPGSKVWTITRCMNQALKCRKSKCQWFIQEVQWEACK